MKKRVLSVLACVLLLIGMMPVRTAAEEVGPAPITEITLVGVSVPSGLTGGASLGVNPGSVAGETPAHVAGAAVLELIDGGDDGPSYVPTEDTVAETGKTYGAVIVLAAEPGYAFAEGIAVQLLRDPEDSESVIPFAGTYINEEGQLVIEFRFGQAGEPEEPDDPEPEPVGTTVLGRIDISVPEAEYGKAPAKPEDYLGMLNDNAAYMVIFGSWTGNFDGAGNYKDGETYTLPITVAVMPNYVIGAETEIYVNGTCLFAKNPEHYQEQADLWYQSTTADLPDSYPITLLNNERGTLQSTTQDWTPITSATEGQTVLISVYPTTGNHVESIYVYLTNDPQITYPSQELNREENSAVFSFVMPAGGVTVGANMTGLPKAETPTAQLKVTGPASAVLTGVDGSMKWSWDGSNYTQIQGSTETIPDVRPGMLYVVRSGDGVLTSDSDPQVITISKFPAPTQLVASACTTEDNNDGVISGLEAGMEWRVSGETEFTAIGAGETELTGLTPGSYDFRYGYNEATLASDIVTIRIDVYEAEEPEIPYYDIIVNGAAAYDVDGVKINKAQEGDIIRIQADDIEGKIFAGWTVWKTNEEQEPVALADPESPETTFVMPAENVAVVANFTEQEDKGFEYIVVYNGNGADSGAMDYQVFYEKEAQELIPNQYSREGYTFLGWSTSEEGEVEYEDGEKITSPLVEKAGQACTLYAVWQDDTPPAKEYKILVSGGTAYVNGEAVTVAEEGMTITVKAADREGKVFVKWVDNENLITELESPETSFTMPGKDVVIMAQFEDYIDKGFEYTVEYDGNGADKGQMAEQTFYEKIEQTLNLNEFKREGYTFMGWSRSETGEVEFEDGANITEPLAGKEGQIRTLYAVWEKDKEEESQPTSSDAETSPSESESAQPTQPTPTPTQPTQPTQPTAHQETWTSPTMPPTQNTSQQEDVPVVVVTTEDEETEVETPEAESTEEMTDREPSAPETPTAPPTSESTEKEEQAVKRIRLVLGIAIGVVAAAIVVAVVFYQREKKRHGNLL